MRESIERTFGPWKYELRLSKLFQLRDTTEPVESSSTILTKLYIRLKLDAVRAERDFQHTEELCIKVTNAPGVVEQFETYLKERCDSSTVLTIILHATSVPVPSQRFMPLSIELPIDLRLRTNWVRFGPLSDVAARATHLRFYGESCAVPDTKDLVTFQDEEMKSAEKVDILEDYMKIVGCGATEWKRVGEVVFVRKQW